MENPVSENRFTCKAQADPFKKLLQTMAGRPQDYVSSRERTTNAVEGFHGLALMYRTKRIYLGHFHCVCKTNMSICHKVQNVNKQRKKTDMTIQQNLGPIWKMLCCSEAGVDMPLAAVEKILEEHKVWVEQREKRFGVHLPKAVKKIQLPDRIGEWKSGIPDNYQENHVT